MQYFFGKLIQKALSPYQLRAMRLLSGLSYSFYAIMFIGEKNMNTIFNESIILIGGMSIGKSTIAQLLNKQTNMPIISTDAVRCEVLESMSNYSFDKQLLIRKEKGFKGEMEFLIPYSNIAITKVLDSIKTPSIIDVGAFFPNQLTDEIIEKFSKFKRVILLETNNINNILKRRNINPNSEIGKIYLQTLDSSLYDSIATQKINIDDMSEDEIINKIVSNSYDIRTI